MDERSRQELRQWVERAKRIDPYGDDPLHVGANALLAENGRGDAAAICRELIKLAERHSREAPTRDARARARTLLLLLRRATASRQRLVRRAAIAGGAAFVLTVGGGLAARAYTAPSIDVAGPDGGAQFGPTQLDQIAFVQRQGLAHLDEESWTLDGRDVTDRLERDGSSVVFRPARLPEGRHELVVTARGGLLGASASERLDFVIDLTPPAILLEGQPTAKAREPLDLRGSVDAGATLTVAGRRVELDEDGGFAVQVDPPFTEPVRIMATDSAGNRLLKQLMIKVVPRQPAVPMRAVHVTAYGWANKKLHDSVMELIAERKINAVELDLKDEAGEIGFGPPLPLALRIGASRRIYDLEAAVRELHSKGIRVIGRLVCFRDPIAANAAWREGRRMEVVQTPGGDRYAPYGGFTNVASPAVRRYNIAVAVAAAKAGVDDILYDYVRRPDGPASSMVFPGLRGTPSDAVVRFLRESRRALEQYGTYLGASVFGVAASRPEEVAQNVPAMARELDYVSPMVYPSHWNRGEYGVANPNAQPYFIVIRSLKDFKRQVEGTGARLVPWLQDFSMRVHYGAPEVRSQIEAAEALGIKEFILWDPDVTYTGAALASNARASKHGLATPAGD